VGRHRFEIRAALVLRCIGFIDASLIAPSTCSKLTSFVHAGGSDPSCLLLDGGLVPARFLSVVAAHVQCVINHNGPNPCGGAVRLPFSRKGEMCRSSVSPILCSSSFDHVVIVESPLKLACRNRIGRPKAPHGRSSVFIARARPSRGSPPPPDQEAESGQKPCRG